MASAPLSQATFCEFGSLECVLCAHIWKQRICMYIYGRVSLILFSLSCARQPSWPIPLGQPVAHTPWAAVAHTPLAASGPYPWTASGPYQRQPSRPIPTSTTVLPLRVHAEVVSDPKRSLPGRFQSMFSAPGTLLYFLIRAVLLRFIRGIRSCTKKITVLYWRQILYNKQNVLTTNFVLRG